MRFALAPQSVFRQEGSRTAAHALLTGLAVALAGVAAVWFGFREELAGGLVLLLGDRYDGMIAVAILEHWYNVLRGLSPWATTFYFHPTPHTLGYNDGYFLFGFVYAAWRALGIDPFLSAELVAATLRAAGFAAFCAMGRRVFALPLAWSVFAAVLFTVANNLFTNAHHAQLFAVAFVPVMVLLLHGAVVAFWHTRSRALVGWGAGAAAFFGAWLLTGYYMAWFFAFYALATVAVLACFARRPFVRALRERTAAARVPLALVAAAFVASIAPFAWLYLPKAAETGMHSYAVALSFVPTPLDLLNVGEGNVVWGALVRIVDEALGARGFATGESRTGIPLAMLGTFAASLAWLALRRRRDPRDVPVLVLAMAIAVVVTGALTVRVGTLSGWWLVYHAVPGAGAVRAVIRYPIFLFGPMAIVVAWSLAHLRLRSRTFTAALLLALVLEEANTLPPLGLERFAELARLRALGPPPGECKLFYASSARAERLYTPEIDARYSHNVDAMMVAETFGIPTINGMASFSPPYWDLFDPDTPTYRERVQAHVARLHLPPPCALDLRNLRWHTP